MSYELALLKGRLALRLTPDAASAASRTRTVAELMDELVADGWCLQGSYDRTNS